MTDESNISTPPGWFADPQHHGQERWWSGRGWTEYTRPRAMAAEPPAPPVPPVPVPKPVTRTSSPARRRLRGRDVVAIVVAAVLVLVGLPTGLSGVLIMLALGAIIISIVALKRGRSRTFRIRSRPVALGVLAVASVALIGGTSAYGAAHPTSAVVAAPASSAAPAQTGKALAAVTTPSPSPSSTTEKTAAVPTNSALAVLATLTIKGKSPLTGYDRTGDFGPAWLDVDRNGCDTRNDILRRDLTATTGSGCRVLTGTLKDPYTGEVIRFVRGNTTSTAVQIDHVVSLADAWQTGAQKLTLQQRADLGNDPINLFAVDGPTNESKGDGDTATWLPPNKSFRCEYVAHQVAVKAAYALWVTKAEHDAMQRVLTSCPTITAPASGTVYMTPTVPEKTTALKPVKTAKPTVYYANCAAVRAAGKAPLHRGDAGYRAGLDRDGDGVACESSSSGSSSGSSGSSGSTSGAPAGATAQCRDGSYSYSAHRSGTCSHHGGVATWL